MTKYFVVHCSDEATAMNSFLTAGGTYFPEGSDHGFTSVTEAARHLEGAGDCVVAVDQESAARPLNAQEQEELLSFWAKQ